MKYAGFDRRFIAGIIDTMCLIFILPFVAMLVLISLIHEDFSGSIYGGLSFVSIILALSPMIVIPSILLEANFSQENYLFIVILIAFLFAEILYYSVLELMEKRSVGYCALNIKTEYVGTENRIFRIFLRSIMRTISRYFYGIPLFTMFLFEKKRAFYDVVVKSVVYDLSA